MRGVNKVILVGNLGKDPDVQYLDNNVSLARFSLATNDSYKDKDGNRVDQTEWHNIVAWRALAKVAEDYLKKGSKIYLEGKIRTRSWDDKQTGEKKYSTEIVADNFIMLDKRDDSAGPGSYAQPAAKPAKQEVPNSPAAAEEAAPQQGGDDLPF